MTTPTEINVGWVFGLARTGSSITAYASAAPWKLPVADEILGPWERTGPPYYYPPEQVRLTRLFKASHARLTPEIARLTRTIFWELAQERGTTRLVSKHPHLRFTPEELRRFFPEDRGVWIIRNPLRRLASIHARGWTSIVRPNHDLDFFRAYAERWLSLPEENRLVFESLKKDPYAYFAHIYRAWGWDATWGDIERAVAYQKSQYHGMSGEVEKENAPQRTLSDSTKSVPREAVRTYLDDPFMRDLFERLGWSTRARDYVAQPPSIAVRVRRKLGAMRTEAENGA